MEIDDWKGIFSNIFTNMNTKATAIDLENRLIRFSVRVIKMAGSLPRETAARHLSLQIIRSGSSPALNYGEAQNAESIEDFVHKMKICLKELRETFICLKIIDQLGWFPNDKLAPLLNENNELIAIFTASAKTASNNKSKIPKSK